MRGLRQLTDDRGEFAGDLRTSWSVWLPSAVRVVPTVCRPPLISVVSCARCSTSVCIGRTAWCSASNSSGAVSCRPRVASVNAEMVVGLSGSVADDRVRVRR